MDIRELLTNKDYDFLKPIMPKVQYLTLGGSKAYGTNKPTSDTDIRGFFLEDIRDVITMRKNTKEEIENRVTDTVIYSTRKFFELLTNCNPNVIEMLGTRLEDVIYATPTAKMLRKNAEMFLSKRAYYSFTGYATAQLRRLENAMARNDDYPEVEKEQHIMKSLENEMLQNEDVFGIGSFHLYIENDEIKVDANIKDASLRNFIRVSSLMSNMVRNYDKLNNRNNKKDEEHLYKHAMHLIRLYLMCIDILANHKIVTYREKEHDLLMDIRNGKMSFESIFALQKEFERETKIALEKSSLPDEPDRKSIDNLYFSIITNQEREI